jgi:23S rRNA pseudouridine2457 synthase
LEKTTKYQYILFNKPFGVLSSFTDSDGRPTLKSYISVPDVYAAGRLDFDSEGALILTNDGGLISQITRPVYHIPKTYWVMVLGMITDEALVELCQGVLFEGVKTRRCEARRIPDPHLPERDIPGMKKGAVCWIEIILREGRKRQVRRMTAAVGFPTLRLYRIAIGNITVEDLETGKWRFLKPSEIESLRKSSRGRR